MEWLKGKKTYIVMFLTAGLGLAMAFGVVIPEWVWVIDGAVFGGTLRAGIAKAGG
ncbi:MAG: hypothetical protein IIA63_12315 [Nitrospinae bacterium]|nr:hypothetical protein [Nitrospinota bacterium]